MEIEILNSILTDTVHSFLTDSLYKFDFSLTTTSSFSFHILHHYFLFQID